MKANDPIWAPDPDGRGGLFRATFRKAAPNDSTGPGGKDLGTAWVSYDEGESQGTSVRVPISEILERDPKDKG